MSKTKIKNEDTEVLVARSKLDGVLQTLVDQKEEGASPEKESSTRNDPGSDFFDSPVNSINKKSPRMNKLHRKRKLVKEETQSDYFSNTYLMKLFDRTVNLAAFTDDSPLYPVCRAWIRNLQPAHQHKEASTVHDNEGNVDNLVFELPAPTDDQNHTTTICPSAPKPVKGDPFTINDDSSSMEEIFHNHMIRWKKVKQSWKQASRQQEGRYIESYRLLKAMYNRHYNDE